MRRASGGPSRSWWHKEYSRREVLKGVAVGALGLGVVQTTGCALFTTQAGGENELEVWHWETPPHRVKAYEGLFKRFTEETGISITQVPINYPEYPTKITAAAESDTLPDIVFANPAELTLLLSSDSLVPLDDVFNDVHNSVNFLEKSYTDYTIDGTQWGLPLFGISWPLTYRADLHEEAGFDGAPETWDDLLARAEKMHSTKLSGYYQPISTDGNYGNQSVWGYLRTNGAKIVSGPPGEEKAAFDSKETIETYEFLKQLAEFTGAGAENASWGSTELLIRGGNVQTLIYTGSPLGDLVNQHNNEELAKKYSMALVPGPSASSSTYNTGYTRAALVTAPAEERGKLDAAKEWLKWVSEPENNAEMLLANRSLFMPVSTASNEAETWTQDSFNQEFKGLIDLQTEAMQYVSVQGFEEGAKSLEASAIENSRLAAEVLQDIVLKDVPVDEAVGAAHTEYEQILERINY